jgi:hypothetical protein
LSQFLNSKKPDLVALQHTSPQLLPDRIKTFIYQAHSAARKWQVTAEIAETAVLKEKYFLRNPKSGALNVKKGYRIGYV